MNDGKTNCKHFYTKTISKNTWKLIHMWFYSKTQKNIWNPTKWWAPLFPFETSKTSRTMFQNLACGRIDAWEFCKMRLRTPQEFGPSFIRGGMYGNPGGGEIPSQYPWGGEGISPHPPTSKKIFLSLSGFIKNRISWNFTTCSKISGEKFPESKNYLPNPNWYLPKINEIRKSD